MMQWIQVFTLIFPEFNRGKVQQCDVFDDELREERNNCRGVDKKQESIERVRE